MSEPDRECIQWPVTSLSRLLRPRAALEAAARTGWEFVSSVPLSGAYVLDGHWRRLGIDAVIRTCVAGRRLDGRSLERTLFALVANRALVPSSKLAAAGWVTGDVHIDGLGQVSDDRPGPRRPGAG